MLYRIRYRYILLFDHCHVYVWCCLLYICVYFKVVYYISNYIMFIAVFRCNCILNIRWNFSTHFYFTTGISVLNSISELEFQYLLLFQNWSFNLSYGTFIRNATFLQIWKFPLFCMLQYFLLLQFHSSNIFLILQICIC